MVKVNLQSQTKEFTTCQKKEQNVFSDEWQKQVE